LLDRDALVATSHALPTELRVIRQLDVLTSLGATVARLGSGMAVAERGARPAKTLQLYEFEGCPYCRKVREALSVLDLDADIYPCPKNGPRFRPEAVQKGGKAQFPYLVDPNTKTAIYESDDIVRYLFATYGAGPAPAALRTPIVTDVTSMLASAARLGAGSAYRPARPPGKPLELWSFEASPFCRIAREALCELELPYRLHNVAKGSAQRDAFVARSGKMQVPYVFDPNTGAGMFESAEIVRYLNDTYAA
jgi:glutathione S-transferase